MSNSLHIYDAAAPDDDELVQVHCDCIPRVGDIVHYYVDNPRHHFDENEPGSIEGVVSRVELNIRRMGTSAPVLVSVWLSDCIVSPPNGAWNQPLPTQAE